MAHAKVLISYSHEDASWLKNLQTHLRPLERAGLIDLWDDSRIKEGSNWRLQLAVALDTADVAILLVSAQFLASDFISTRELPALLRAAGARGTLILPIIVGACSFERTKELQEFQAFNPDKPLNTMTKGNRDILFKKVADRVSEAVAGPRTENPESGRSETTGGVSTPSEVVESFPENYGQASFGSARVPAQPKTSIDSTNLPGNSTGVSRNRIPLRRRHFVLAILIGLALGLICAAILARYGFWVSVRPNPPDGNGIIYIVGGGTAHTYLTESGFFKALEKDKQIDVRVLQGPTGTGAELFPHVFDDVTFLIMSSKRLEPHELQSNGKPGAVFEAYLGADPLQMLLVAGEAGTSESVLNDAFGDILQKSSSDQLDFGALAKIGKWVNPGYAVYTGSEGSGTRAVWKNRLEGTKVPGAWPWNLNIWEIRAPYQMVELVPRARVYLGSEVLTREPIKTLDFRRIPHRRLAMVDGPNGPVARGLYLYGFVDNTQKKKRHGSDYGYHLPEPVVRILKHVYESKNLYLLTEECRKKQLDHFHLSSEPASEAGWVAVEGDVIFGAQPCVGQPKE
jgi:hypothetical protein